MSICFSSCFWALRPAKLNRLLTDGLVKPEVLLRTEDSAIYAYTEVRELPEYRRRFAKEFLGLVDAKKAVDVAGWMHWQINCQGHFYADACGRTAELVGGWVLARHHQPMPTVVDAGEFYRHVASFDEFLRWYRTLHART